MVLFGLCLLFSHFFSSSFPNQDYSVFSGYSLFFQSPFKGIYVNFLSMSSSKGVGDNPQISTVQFFNRSLKKNV